MLIGSLLLHLALLILLFVRFNKPQEAPTPPGVAMVFESGSRNGPTVPIPKKGFDTTTTPPAQATPVPSPETAPQTPPPAIAPAPVPQASPPPSVLPPLAPSIPPPPSVAPTPPPPAPAPLPLEAPAAPPSAALPRTAPPEPHRPAPPVVRPPPRPTPRIEPRREPRSESAFPMPMNFSFGNATSRARSSDSPGAAGTFGPSAREAESAFSRIGSSIRPIGHDVPGGGWINELQAWVKEHGFFPRQAAMNNEEGPVVLRLVIDRTGRVNSLELISRSGSQWLDLGAQSIFRGAHVPPFPADAPYPDVTIDYTLNYIIIRR